jgi:hypothetical protein
MGNVALPRGRARVKGTGRRVPGVPGRSGNQVTLPHGNITAQQSPRQRRDGGLADPKHWSGNAMWPQDA